MFHLVKRHSTESPLPLGEARTGQRAGPRGEDLPGGSQVDGDRSCPHPSSVRSAGLSEGETQHNHGWQPELTRRQLFKLGAVGASVMATQTVASRAAQAEEFIRGGRSISRTTATLRRAVPSTCGHCPARCGILGFVEEDKLVKIEGNPRDPNNRGRLCARGHAGINRLYDPDRVLFPMERTGRRGEGKWVRLSWQQAYDVLEERLRDVQARDPGSLIFHAGMEGSGLLASRFVSAFGSKTFLDEQCLHNASREAANRLTLGQDTEVVDVAHARYVLNFGGNPYETHPLYVPFIQRLVDARMGGARLVTFDPRMSLTAGRSDEWFPLAPGSDALVALAMAHVLVQQGLHDAKFLSTWTDLSPDQLASGLAPYTPEAAEAASGIRADDLRRIATEFGRVRPAVAIFGGGVNHQKGAVDTQRAVILLNAVVGSVGAPGGYCPGQTVALPQVDPAPPATPACTSAVQHVEKLVQGKATAGVYVTSMANPAYSWPNPLAFRETLRDEKRIPYLVAIDTDLTETSMLADLVLPAATYLESWGLESPPAQELIPYVTLRQPIVPPQGEALSVDDILLTLGTRLGDKVASFFSFPTVESYVNTMASKISGLSEAGGLALLREQGTWYNASAAPQYRSRPEGFSTGSGKLEFGNIAAGKSAGGQAILAPSGSAPAAASELTLVTYRPNVYSSDYSANCWWLSEIAHNNPLLISPVAAQRLGIKQGQRVRVVSTVGTVEVRARITQGMHPQVVALATGFGHVALGRVARGESFRSNDPMTSHLWWDKQDKGVNPSALLSGKIDESGGGLVWMDTRVRVEAVG